MKIHFFEKKSSPLYVRVIIKAGARYDSKEGVAHFLEHMLCAGTKRFPSKDLLAEYIENSGGTFSLSTDSDYIRINIQVADGEDMPLVSTLLYEMLHETLFDPVIFEKEKGSILSELANQKVNQKEYVWQVYKKVFFQKTPLAQSVLGTEESIMSITLQDLISFKEKMFNQDSISCIVVGDIDKIIVEKELTKIIERYKTNTNNVTEVLPIISEVSFYHQEYDSKLSSLVLGFRTETYSILNDACALICAHYFGGGRTSSLIKILRYEKGLVYGVSAQYSLQADRGAFFIKTDCESRHAKEVYNIIKTELLSFSDHLFSEEKLIFLKSKIVKSYRIRLQTSESYVIYNEKSVVIPQSLTIEEFIKSIEKITLEDIAFYIKNNFIPQNFFVAHCGPQIDFEN